MTSWTNSTPIRSATLSPAEPVTAQWKVSCGKACTTSSSRVRRAPRASALWRRYELKRSASSSSTTALTVVDPTSRPSESNGSSDQNDRSVPGFTVTEPHPRPLPHPRRRPVREERTCALEERICTGPGNTNAASRERDGAASIRGGARKGGGGGI